MGAKKISVVGAGIFGCSIAIELDKCGHDVFLYEKENDIMLGATKNNHNRVHYGYHYPRSLDTTRQSLEGLVSFYSQYGGAVIFGFPNYYAIASGKSLTSVSQFKEFCREAGIGIKNGFPDNNFINKNLVDDCYLVEEPIYDWTLLQEIAKQKLSESGISVLLNTDFRKTVGSFDFVINCTYSSFPAICDYLGVKNRVQYRLQDVFIPIFRYNHSKIGLTVMDGEFCSVMPNGGNENQFLLYHAKNSICNLDLKDFKDVGAFLDMIVSESSLYFPFLSDVDVINYYRSWRVLPVNNDDERLSEIIMYKENKNFITVFSGKVTTAVRTAKQIAAGIETGYFNSHILV